MQSYKPDSDPELTPVGSPTNPSTYNPTRHVLHWAPARVSTYKTSKRGTTQQGDNDQNDSRPSWVGAGTGQANLVKSATFLMDQNPDFESVSRYAK